MKLFLKSLISNNRAIDGARKKGNWWVALLLGVISIILSVVPTFVNNITIKGENILKNNTYGVDSAIRYLAEVSEEKNYKLIVKDPDETHKNKHLVSENFKLQKYEKNGQVDAIFAYYPALDESDKELLNSTEYTIFVFDEESVRFSISNPNTNTLVNNSTKWINSYKDFKDGTNLIEELGEPSDQTFNKFQVLMNDFSDFNRVASSWVTTGIMAAISLGVMLLMGFMIWLLCRGKNNPFRMYTILDGFKIAAWCALTPALITVPLAFLIKGLPDVWFPMLLGIRCMWLTMKSLRPDGSGYVEPKEIKTVNVK